MPRGTAHRGDGRRSFSSSGAVSAVPTAALEREAGPRASGEVRHGAWRTQH
jgi:hypothetical protein